MFLPHTKLSLGCGNKCFWTDPWLDSQPLASRFPRLFNLSSFKSEVILRFLSPSSNWDFHFRWNLRDPEIIELSSLLVVLQNSLLSLSRYRCSSWSLTSSGLFSVSFFFSALSALSSSPSFLHKTEWTSPIPSKLQAFLWKIAWNRVPTLNIIQSFNPNLTLLPNICSLCLLAAETTDHLFSLLLYLEPLGSYFPVGEHFLCSSGENDWPHLPLEVVISVQVFVEAFLFIFVSTLSYGPYGRKWIDGFFITLLGTSLQCGFFFFFNFL